MPEPNTTERKSGRLTTALLLLLVVGILAVALRANMWKSDLRILDVGVEGNKILTEKEVKTLAGIDINQKLFDVDLYTARTRIEKNSFVSEAAVTRDVPNRICISVVERVPVAIVIGEQMLYLDSEGFVLPPTGSEHMFDLPVLTGWPKNSALVPGKQTTNPQIREALALLFLAKEMNEELYHRISEVHRETSGDIVLYTAELGVPVMVGKGDIIRKMAKFDAFWTEFVSQHGASELQYVDLRFEDQVVVRWNHGGDGIKKTKSHDRSTSLKDSHG
ncbi:MAG: cell division protein FtsQ/DivIB [Bacteroidota bacterium]